FEQRESKAYVEIINTFVSLKTEGKKTITFTDKAGNTLDTLEFIIRHVDRYVEGKVTVNITPSNGTILLPPKRIGKYNLQGEKLLGFATVDFGNSQTFDLFPFNSPSMVATGVEIEFEDGSKYRKGLDSWVHNSTNLAVKLTKNGEVGIFRRYSPAIPIHSQTFKVRPFLENIVLGELEITVIDNVHSEKNIGEVTAIIDSRVQRIYDKGHIFYLNGDIRDTRSSGVKINLPELLKINGTYNVPSGVTISDVVKVQDRPEKNSFINGIWSFSKNNGIDISMIVGEGLLSNFQDKMLVQMNYTNTDLLDNTFTLLGNDNFLYKGNMKETYVDKYYEGIATLDMSMGVIGTLGTWEVGSTGVQVSNDYKLDLGNTKLLDSRGFGNTNIITKLVVKQNGVSKEMTGTIGNKIEVVFDENKIGFNDDGTFFVSKENNSLVENEYEIIPFYKDIPLGKLTVRVVNNIEIIDIGEVEFNVDKRLEQLIGSYVFANGKVVSSVGASSDLKYSELIRVENKFKNLESTNIKDVISIEGRPFKSSTTNNYIDFRITSSNYVDDSVMPYEINLNTLDDNILISKRNSTNSDMLNNRFILLGKNEKYYKGNIKENYDTSSPKDGYTGKAELNLTNVDRNKNYTFMKNSVVGEVESKEDSKIKLNLLEGKLPQTQGYYNKNILTSIRVSKNGTLVSDSGVNYDDENYSLEFDTDGNLIVRKKSIKDYSDNLEIEYMYHDVKLGSLSLKLENSVEVEIVGDDVIDFGKIFQGKKSKTDGKIQIKSSSKIVTVEIDENYAKELVHMGTNEKLPYTARVNSYSQGFEIPVGIEIELEPSDIQELGTYTGEFNLIVTIE
ncbi:MAG: hypothetical protein ACRCW5_09115, partial [Cetobacterium sp.]|uniref:hypothetical protein n=1 Tax=Cetobacterium sp. TaxID=2071632 RepID=UPI003F3BE16C